MQEKSVGDTKIQPSTLPSTEKGRRSLLGLLRNPFVVAYVVIYIIFILLLSTIEKFGIIEPLFALIILGVGFSAFAWWVTKGVGSLTISIKKPTLECGLLAFYLLFVMIPFMSLINNDFITEPLRSLVVLIEKLTLFVLIPFMLFRRLWGYRLKDFISFSFNWKKHLRVVLWMSLILVIFQLVFGSGLTSIQQSGLNTWQFLIGVPFVFLWLTIEVGLVEEFFFRALLQSRFAALFRSEIAGIVLMALLFGLAHAPGLYIRTSSTLEPIGSSPSPLMAIGYSIVVISVTGFFLGVIWYRTKNLLVLIMIHAIGDLIPGMVEIIKTWLVR